MVAKIYLSPPTCLAYKWQRQVHNLSLSSGVTSLCDTPGVKLTRFAHKGFTSYRQRGEQEPNCYRHVVTS